MRSRPAYSVIVPFHSNERLLRLCVRSLLATLPSEVEKIIVLNNAEPKRLPSKSSLTPFVALTRSENIGYSAAANLGAAHARGRNLIFCDADTIYSGRWFAELTSLHRTTANVGLVSSRLLDARTGRIADYGIGFSPHNAPHPQRDLRPMDPAAMTARQVQAACSANMIIAAPLFAEVGGFDETLLNAYADLDLCLRLNERGRPCWVTGKSMVHHRGDSADTHRDCYRADVKAAFAQKNAGRIRTDMQDYFRASLRRHARTHGFAREYLLVDLSTVVDRRWHYELLREFVSLAAIYDYSLGVRDQDDVSLVDHLGLQVVDTRHALLYFTDRFVALRNSGLWRSLRPRKDDLVVDRNANVRALTEVICGDA